MKRFLLSFLALIIIGQLAAQSFDEVIYLKNGSEIHGSVIEYTSGETIKIQTRDGSIFVFQSDEVERISKAKTPEPSTSGLQRGYRCFLDVANTLGTDMQAELSTLHGYQFNKHLFLGGGVGVHYHSFEDTIYVPFFGAFRYDIINRRATPFIELRGGYAVGAAHGSYFSQTVGARIRLGDWGAINLGLGITTQHLRYDDADDPSDTIGGLTLRVGFEF